MLVPLPTHFWSARQQRPEPQSLGSVPQTALIPIIAPAEQESAACAEAAKAAIAEKTSVLKSIVAKLHVCGEID
jgi:uncharacterized membrane protein